jgi:hypothetical protein
MTRATVVGLGLAAAVAVACGSAGARTVTAPATSCTGKAPWPCEPAGLAVITDVSWATLPAPRWEHANFKGFGRVVPDPDAPLSKQGVLEIVFPVGFPGGEEPAKEQYIFRAPHPRELFVGTHFKMDPDFQGHSGGINKLINAWTGNGGENATGIWWLVLRSVSEVDNNSTREDGPYFVDGAFCGEYHGAPGTNRNQTPVSLGRWHRLEWHIKLPSAAGARDGEFRWWLDGVLSGEYTGLGDCLGQRFEYMEIAPTFGGGADTKRQADYLRFDHMHVSGR